MKPIIVCAGYGSWARASVNPASLVLAELEKRKLENCTAICLEVPVDSAKLWSFVQTTLQKYEPDAWLGFGVAVNSPVIRSEMIGLNMMHFDVPDVAGHRANCERIVDTGPEAYQSDFPHQKIIKNLRASHIPAVLSFHAGTHLCNQMLYTVRHQIIKTRRKTISGFIHLPQSSSNVAASSLSDELTCSMSLELMSSGSEIVLNTLIDHLNGNSNQ